MTEKGRVVYDRKKDLFKPKDIARVLDAYSETAPAEEKRKKQKEGL